MLTSRGWWFLLTNAGLLALALLANPSHRMADQRPNVSLILLALTLGLWFAWEWLLFDLRARFVSRRLRLSRELRDDRGPVDNLWAGKSCQVRVEVRLDDGPLGLPYVVLTDLFPYGAEPGLGERRHEGPVAPGRSLEFSYGLRCPAAGRLRFEGLTVQLADWQGFFYHAGFLSAPVEYRVLPALTDVEGRAAVKRHNLLPPPGIHRHRRPGAGSELLDLRDYLPGDPPKTIAWKPSARRDRLITKEFESEVPVRCTLFVDISHAVRLGPPGQNPLARLVEIAAAVAQAASGARDLTGLCLFDEDGATYVRPARGARHLVGLLNRLADAAGLAPCTGRAPVDGLLPTAYAFAREVYPQLLRPELNRVPFWLPWLRPQPGYTIRRPTLADRANRLLPGFLVGYLLLGIPLLALGVLWLASVLSAAVARGTFWIAVVFFVLLAFGLILAFFRIPLAYFFPRRRRLYRWRKQLAALLSVRCGLAPGGLAALQEDDDRLSAYLQRFLAEHHVPFSLPRYDRRGGYLFASPAKATVLANALLRAVAKGHDNELYVLLADFLELGERLDPVIRAVKVALARHHRVLVVCPWPPGMPPPDPADGGGVDVSGEPGRATTERLHREFHRLRRQLSRLGVPVICATGGEPVRLILDRLERLRSLGGKR
jgi:uncharacterized protein (DUF58 family)